MASRQDAIAQVKKERRYQTSLFIAPVISIYNINPNHTKETKSRPAFTAIAAGNIRLNRSAYIGIGVQYLLHGNTFKSYYFKDSILNLYDKEYAYEYTCRYQDLCFPLSFKLKLGENKQKANRVYTVVTWTLRKRVATSMEINSIAYGYSEYFDKAGNEFRSRYLKKTTGSLISLGLGYDKNFHEKNSAYFILLNYSYGLNTFYFYRNNSMPKDLWQNESFLSIGAGIRF